MKKCRACRTTKPFSEFHRTGGGRYRSECKACRRALRKPQGGTKECALCRGRWPVEDYRPREAAHCRWCVADARRRARSKAP